MQIIGSLKEGTKIFCTDELDIHFSLNSFQAKDVKFLPEEQIILVHGKKFPAIEYATFYFKTIKKILDPLTSYTPCLYCMDMTDEEVQPKRCHHKPDCPIHRKKSCKDTKECPIECDCRNFTNPAIGWSKIGAVLHFGRKLFFSLSVIRHFVSLQTL